MPLNVCIINCITDLLNVRLYPMACVCPVCMFVPLTFGLGFVSVQVHVCVLSCTHVWPIDVWVGGCLCASACVHWMYAMRVFITFRWRAYVYMYVCVECMYSSSMYIRVWGFVFVYKYMCVYFPVRMFGPLMYVLKFHVHSCVGFCVRVYVYVCVFVSIVCVFDIDW